MLQHVLHSNFANVAVRSPFASQTLEHIFKRVRLSLVEFNAQDIYQVCSVAFNMDTLGMMQDDEFMRGLAAAFQRSDQSVVSPFQANLIADTFRKANINVSPKEVAVPEPDAVSPESLINLIRQMNITKQRDEKKLEKIMLLMFPILDEFTPTQLSLAVAELSRIQCHDAQFMARIARRIFQVSDDLSTLDISLTAVSLANVPGMQHNLLVETFRIVEERCHEFLPDDYVNVLEALNKLGPKFMKCFAKLVEQGLVKVENMDAVTLTRFLSCFVTLGYRNRSHIEIYGDAIVEVLSDLNEKDLMTAFQAVHRLNLLSEYVFGAFASCAMRFAARMDPRNISPLMDICSQVPFTSDLLMRALLDRCVDLTRLFTPPQLGDILEIVCMYPPARDHPIVEAFGRQVRLRIDLMSAPAIAAAVRGLSHLGYVDPELYIFAAETFNRYGFKDFSQLDPVLNGLCISQAQVSPVLAKVLASHLAPMAHSMSLADVERANRYMVQLSVEDEWVYRQLAARVLNFIKEVTPDMPQELQILMHKGAAAMQPGVS